MTEAAIVALLACCVALLRALVRERRARRDAEANAREYARRAELWREDWTNLVLRRTRSVASELCEGCAYFSTVDELTAGKR